MELPSDIIVDNIIANLTGGLGVVNQVMVHNDNVNTFDHVINTFIEECGMEPMTAVNCAKSIHENGICGIMVGTRSELLPIVAELAIAGLDAEII